MSKDLLAFQSDDFDDDSSFELSEDDLRFLENHSYALGKFKNFPKDIGKQFISQLQTDDTLIKLAKEDLLTHLSENKEEDEQNREGVPTLSQVMPPQNAQYCLDLILPDITREYMIGCLQEEYTTRIVPKYGKKYADNWYRVRVAKSIVEVIWSLILRVTLLTWLWRGVDSLYRKHLQ